MASLAAWEARYLRVETSPLRPLCLLQEHYPIVEMAAPTDMGSAHELVCRICEEIKQARVSCLGSVEHAV